MKSRYGSAPHIRMAALAGSGAQMPMHLAQQHAHHGLAQVVAPGQQVPETVRKGQYPLSHRHIRDDVVHQVRGALGHAPAATASTPTHTVRASGTPARTEPSALARERDQALGLAPNALEPCESACEPGAPATRTVRGGVKGSRTPGTPGTPPRQSAARPRRRANSPLRRETSASARLPHDIARPPRGRAGCSRPTAGPPPRLRQIACRRPQGRNTCGCLISQARRRGFGVRRLRRTSH